MNTNSHVRVAALTRNLYPVLHQIPVEYQKINKDYKASYCDESFKS